MPESPAIYVPRHADGQEFADGEEALSGADAREHALALLATSPVYARVARLLGLPAVPPTPQLATDIGIRLARLPAEWRVLPDPDVDHLVVGPGGVFAVVERSHPQAKVTVRGNAFRADGRSRSDVADARKRAARVAARLAAAGVSVEVCAVLAVAGAERGFAVRQQPKDVTVVNRRTVTAFLHSRPASLEPVAVARISDAASA